MKSRDKPLDIYQLLKRDRLREIEQIRQRKVVNDLMKMKYPLICCVLFWFITICIIVDFLMNK